MKRKIHESFPPASTQTINYRLKDESGMVTEHRINTENDLAILQTWRKKASAGTSHEDLLTLEMIKTRIATVRANMYADNLAGEESVKRNNFNTPGSARKHFAP